MPTPQKTLFTNLRSSLSSPVLSADLRHQEVGCYTFGAIPSNQYTPPLTYTSVNTARGLWEFSPAGYGVGSNTTLNASSSDLEKLIGIVDTGTTLMLLDDTIVQTYYEHVPTARFEGGLEAWVFDCGVAGNLPDFRVKVGSKGQSKGQGEFEAVVPGAYLNYAPNPDGSTSLSIPLFFLFPFPPSTPQFLLKALANTSKPTSVLLRRPPAHPRRDPLWNLRRHLPQKCLRCLRSRVSGGTTSFGFRCQGLRSLTGHR